MQTYVSQLVQRCATGARAVTWSQFIESPRQRLPRSVYQESPPGAGATTYLQLHQHRRVHVGTGVLGCQLSQRGKLSATTAAGAELLARMLLVQVEKLVEL